MAGTGLFTEILDGEAYKYYSDGEWKKSSSGKLVPIINPTTRKVHYKVQGDYSFSLTMFMILYVLILFCKVNYKYPLSGWLSLYTRRGQQGDGVSKNCTEVMGKDSTLEESRATSQGCFYPQGTKSSNCGVFG